MRPKHRNPRLLKVSVGALALGFGMVLLLSAMQPRYFYEAGQTTQAGFSPESDVFRVGGLVVPGSIRKGEDLRVAFAVKDFTDAAAAPLQVQHTGILPNLFKEDSGVVLTGSMEGDVFVAKDVMAKHDENYRPKLD